MDGISGLDVMFVICFFVVDWTSVGKEALLSRRNVEFLLKLYLKRSDFVFGINIEAKQGVLECFDLNWNNRHDMKYPLGLNEYYGDSDLDQSE